MAQNFQSDLIFRKKSCMKIVYYDVGYFNIECVSYYNVNLNGGKLLLTSRRRLSNPFLRFLMPITDFP